MENPHPGDPGYDDTDDINAACALLVAAALRGFCNQIAESTTEPETVPEYLIATGLAMTLYEVGRSSLLSDAADTVDLIGEQAFQAAKDLSEECVRQSLADAALRRKEAVKPPDLAPEQPPE